MGKWNDVEEERVLREFRATSLMPLTRETRFSVSSTTVSANSSETPIPSTSKTAADNNDDGTEQSRKRGRKKRAMLKKFPKDRCNYSREEKIAIDIISRLPGDTIKTKQQLQSLIDSLLPGYDPFDVLKALAKSGEESKCKPSDDDDDLKIVGSHTKY